MLCEVCQNVDIRSFLTQPDSSLEFELGSWQRIQHKRDRCTLCACVASAVGGGRAAIRRTLRPDTELILIPKATGAARCHDSPGEPPHRAFRLQIVDDDFEDAGDLLLSGADSPAIGQTALFHGRNVRSDSIDFALVASWMKDCREHHAQCNNVQALKKMDISIPRASMLIDVDQQCLVNADAGHQYAALSYVWGDTNTFLLAEAQVDLLRIPGSLSAESIPMTIRDAMTLTNAIGIRYLWVDSLCIVQDNKPIKSQVLQYMHHVYGGATVTIVAADSPHANAGLPGVRSGTRQLQQTIAYVDNLRLVSRLCYLDVTLNRSKYNQRGWTYQESCLSGQLLYITARGVVYHCNQGIRTEEMGLEDTLCGKQSCSEHTTYLAMNQRNLWRDYINRKDRYQRRVNACSCIHNKRARFLDHQLPASILAKTLVPIEKFYGETFACRDCLDFSVASDVELHTYKELIRGYTYRSIRFESDRLPAFAGIAGLLAGQYGTTFLHGMPEKFLDVALLWIPRRNSTTPCRKEGLRHIPSWSWASHEIPVDHRGHIWMTSEVDWYILDTDDRLRPVQSLKQVDVGIPLRENCRKPVDLDQLREHDLLGQALNQSPGPVLVGWCQIVDNFFTRGHRLYDANKQLVYSPIADSVKWSDAAPDENDPTFCPVELLFLARTGHQPATPAVNRLEVCQADWVLSPHTIEVLVIQRTGNVARRLAIADILDVKLWEHTMKHWMLIKLI